MIAIENNQLDVVDELLRQKDIKMEPESVQTLLDLANQHSNYFEKEKKQLKSQIYLTKLFIFGNDISKSMLYLLIGYSMKFTREL